MESPSLLKKTLLGLIPGLGQLLNKLYLSGVIYFSLVTLLIIMGGYWIALPVWLLSMYDYYNYLVKHESIWESISKYLDKREVHKRASKRKEFNDYADEKELAIQNSSDKQTSGTKKLKSYLTHLINLILVTTIISVFVVIISLVTKITKDTITSKAKGKEVVWLTDYVNDNIYASDQEDRKLAFYTVEEITKNKLVEAKPFLEKLYFSTKDDSIKNAIIASYLNWDAKFENDKIFDEYLSLPVDMSKEQKYIYNKLLSKYNKQKVEDISIISERLLECDEMIKIHMDFSRNLKGDIKDLEDQVSAIDDYLKENSTIWLTGWVIELTKKINLSGRNLEIYEIAPYSLTNQHAYLTTSETRFNRKGTFGIYARKTGSGEVELKREFGGFIQEWDFYAEVTSNDMNSIKEKKNERIKLIKQIKQMKYDLENKTHDKKVISLEGDRKKYQRKREALVLAMKKENDSPAQQKTNLTKNGNNTDKKTKLKSGGMNNKVEKKEKAVKLSTIDIRELPSREIVCSQVNLVNITNNIIVDENIDSDASIEYSDENIMVKFDGQIFNYQTFMAHPNHKVKYHYDKGVWEKRLKIRKDNFTLFNSDTYGEAQIVVTKGNVWLWKKSSSEEMVHFIL